MTSSYRLRVLATVLALFVASLAAPTLTGAQPAQAPSLVVDAPNATPFDPRSIDVVTGAATQDFSTLGTFTLPSGASITLEFDVTVDSVIPAGTSAVANQAGIGADQLAMSVPSDDPTTGMSPDPTVTLLFESAEMGITKTDGAASSIPGEMITYTIVVTNSGPFGVLDAEVDDLFPMQLANCSWSCGGTGNCDTANGMGDISAVTVDLEVGQSVTFSATCDIDPAATGTLSNTATVTPPDGFDDPGVNPNSATDDNPLVPTGDLSIDKTTDTTPVVPGNAIQYTVVVANSGPSTATGVGVTDNFPAAVTGATWACAAAGGAACPNGAGAGDIAETVDLPPGGSLTYTVSGTVDAGASGSIMNTASLTVPGGFTDTDDTNDSDTVTDNLDAMIDVAVNKSTLTAPPIVPGAQIQYEIVVDNGGPSDALGVAVTDTFPGALSSISWTCAADAGSSCTAMGNGDVSDNVDIAAGEMVVYTVTATVSPTATGTLTNTATIAPPMGVTDASTGDDSSTVMDSLVPQGDLSVDKQTLTSPVVAGQPVTYQIVVANSGPSTATGAQVQDNFPVALGNESWTCTASAGSSCTAGPQAGDVLDMVTLAGGGSVTYTVTADLAADATGVLSNTATVSIPGGFTDTNMGNESDTVMNAIVVMADLMVLKQDDGPVDPGDPVTYTIVVTNLGPSDVTGATVTDTVPAELTNVTWTCVADPGASCTAMGNGDVNDSVDLAAGTSVTYTVVGDTPGEPASFENTASVEAPAGVTDPTVDNDSDSVVTVVARAVAIPTLSTWGFVLLAALLAGLGLWLLRRRGVLAAGLVLLALLGFAGAADAQTSVDVFAIAQGPNADPPGGPPPISSTVDDAGILGGERDLAMNRISGAGTVTGEVTGGAFEFVAPAATRGEATLTWDGDDDDADALDPVGLGGVNLTTTGQSGFRINVDAASQDTELIVRVFTDAANHSQAARLVSTAIAADTDVFIPFSEFRSVAGSGADFTDVGAVVLAVRGENVVVTIDEFDTAGPLLTVSKVDLDPNTNTEIGANEVSAGSTIRYRVTVTNAGGEATTVDVTDVVDSNTALVANTLNSTPVAVPDAYRWYGNVTLTVPDGPTDLLANDADPDGDTFTVTAFDATSAQNGAVTVTPATGAFEYQPPAGFTGVDSFTYTIEDDDGNASTATATIALLSTIWFVDSDACPGAPPCGTGTQADPFGELEQAEAASGPNDIIRLRQGAADTTNHNLGIVLKAGQQLIGQGVDLVVDGVHIEGDGAADGNLDPNAANRPSLTHSSMGGEGITLSDGVTVLGLNVDATADSAIFGSNVDGIFIDHVAVTDSAGAALEITNSTNLDLTFTGLDSLNSSEHGVFLDAVTGTLAVTGTTQIDDPAFSGIRIEDSPAFTATFAAVDVVDSGGAAQHAAIHLSSNMGASLTFGTMNLDSANGDGFFAVDSGMVNHPASGNTVNAVGGAAVDIQSTTGNAGGSPGWSFDSLASTNSPDFGVRLVAIGTDFTVGAGGTTVTDADSIGIMVQNAGGQAIDFEDTVVVDTNVGMGATADGINLATGNGGATFTFDSLQVVTDGGFGLLASFSGTINIAGTDGNLINATGGPALDVTSTNTGAGWTFDELSSTGSPGTGVNLVSVTGSVTGESGDITGSASTAFNVNGAAPTVVYSGNVTQNNAQRVVTIQNTTGGSVTFNTGTVTGGANSLGVLIDNADGNASFADLNLGTVGTPMTSQALTLSGGSTGTFGFAGTQIFTNGANGVQASNGGVVEFTGGGNRVTATNARALTFENGTTIGGNGATFERIDASGSDRGIRLSGAGSGGFTVTGVSTTDGTGGVIQTITQRGIEIIQTNNIALSNMTLTNANTTDGAASDGTSGGNENTDENGAIHLENLSTVDLTNVDINGSAQHGINGNTVTDLDISNSVLQNNGDEIWESGIYIFQLFGTVADGADNLIANSTITDSGQFNVFVRNNTATNQAPGAMDRLAFDTVTFQDSGVNVAGDHVTISNRETAMNDAANFQTVVTGSTFTATIGDTSDSIQVDAGDSSRSDVSITSSSFVNGNLGINISGSGTSVTTFDVSNNPQISSRASSGVNIAANGSSSMTGTIANNPNITSNFANNNGFGVDVVVDQTGSAVVDIDNNTITAMAFGIRAGARNPGTGTADVTIQNNNISTGGTFAFNAIFLFAGNGSVGESNRTCVHLDSNTTSTAFGDDEYFLEQYTGNTFQLQGLTPASGATQAQVEAFVEGTDTGSPTADAGSGSIVNYTAATCATP